MILFFLNAPPTTDIYTLSLHDALPISPMSARVTAGSTMQDIVGAWPIVIHPPVKSTASRGLVPNSDSSSGDGPIRDRKSTRLNSSHMSISYAVFCLKKKKKHRTFYLKP